MSQIVNGTADAVPQPIRSSFHPQRGWTVSQEFRGPKAAITAVSDLYAALGWQVDYTSRTGAVWSVVVATSNDNTDPNAPQNVINDWTFSNGESEKSILYADTATVNAIPQYEKNAIQSGLATPPVKLTDPIPKGTKYIDGNGHEQELSFDSPVSPVGKQLFAFMRMGLASVPVFQPIIRHTMTVSNLYSVRAANLNAKKVMTTAQLVALENPPASLLVDLEGVAGDNYTGTLPLKYGWLKYPPEKSQSAFNRVTIAQIWKYGLYDTIGHTFV